jgi:hypothetical protein
MNIQNRKKDKEAKKLPKAKKKKLKMLVNRLLVSLSSE